ncbi:CHAT domain-containing protein [Scytonema hofmannii FACHB-248]|uniref:CHAT domain-containing protein n=1 Tax=Scytonema hofmannii FACHB-248 TaxID=1842502 RepID=A0ABR8GV68_9CYAN|nr:MULTISPECIES: CHAT domain-containing protein [Nostocales]MBD2607395.1 CHAT domain-containing protein [Scytonema hofmannii FACHB-248]
MQLKKLSISLLLFFLVFTSIILPNDFLRIAGNPRTLAQTPIEQQKEISSKIELLESTERSVVQRLNQSGASHDSDSEFSTLYDIGFKYFNLAQISERLGYLSQKNTALAGAERVLTLVVSKVSVFSYKPTPSQCNSSTSPDGFNFSFTCSIGGGNTSSATLRYQTGDVENSTFKLLQQVYVAQNRKEDALLAAEYSRTIDIDKNLLFNLNDGNWTKFVKDLSPRLTIEDIKKIAKNENSTIVSYSIISYEDDIKYLVSSPQNPGNTPPASKLYIWVIRPTGQISFVERPLQLGALQNDGQTRPFPEECKLLTDVSDDCRGEQLTALAQGIAKLRGSLGVRERGTTLNAPSSLTPKQITEQNKQLNQLYQLLIAPIQDLLPAVPEERVIFIPQGSLYFIPFAILKDSSGKYLIEKHTILTSPNLRALLLSSRNRERSSSRSKNALIVGNPTMPTIKVDNGNSTQKLEPLPGAANEAREVAQLLKQKKFDVDLLTDNQADENRVIRRMRDARIIHLATHGIIDTGSDKLNTSVSSSSSQKPQGSLAEKFQERMDKLLYLYRQYQPKIASGVIALAPSKDEDGLLNASEIIKMKLRKTDLVVLSACNTGRGPLTPGGVVGLPFSFSVAGVPSIVVSLWSVPDDSTAQLMTKFYGHLLNDPNTDKAQALRRAMLEMMQKNPDNPKEWAAFTLVGSAN